MMSEDTLRKVQAMFQTMTETGLFDELAAYIHPDQINEVCDAVDRAVNRDGEINNAPPGLTASVVKNRKVNLHVCDYLEPAQ